MFFRISAGVARNDDLVSGFQGVAVDVLSTQLTRATPLDAPPSHDSLCVRSIDLNERMGITELELNDGSFYLDGLVFVIRRGEGMMRVQPNTGDEHCDGEQR